MSENWLSGDVLKRTIREVERDEAEAIVLLVNLLDKVRETSHTAPLESVCNILKQWQNRPPGGIVTELTEIGKTLKCETHDNP